MIHVAADTTGHTYPSAAANAFVDAAALAIEAKLSSGKRTYGLMPYRRDGEYLGFDWHDEANNHIGFTFYVVRAPFIEVSLPATIDLNGADVGLRDMTDALLLCRLIAERVNGNALGSL